MRPFLAIFISTAALWAQTRPVATSALNAASFAAPSQPGGKLARGGIFTTFGRNLATEPAAADAFPIAESLAGVQLEITVDGTTRQALPLFVSEGQINAIMPSDVPPGAGELTVILDGMRGEPLPVEIADHAPGVFTLRGTGAGPAVMTDPLETDPNLRINSGLRAAHAGDPWDDLWATGMGPIPGSDAEQAPLIRGDERLTDAVNAVIPEWWISGTAYRTPYVDAEVRFSLTDGVSCRIVDEEEAQ